MLCTCTWRKHSYCTAKYSSYAIIHVPLPPSLPPSLPLLQEVETEQYYSFFQPELGAQGYESIFNPKSRARTMDQHDRKYVDGCAIFFHKSK